METLGLNLIRTYVALAVGAGISWLVAHGVKIDTQTSVAVSAALTSVITAAYYTVVRVLEEHWPQAGLLLGARRLVVSAAEEWPPEADENEQWPAPEPTADHPVQQAAASGEQAPAASDGPQAPAADPYGIWMGTESIRGSGGEAGRNQAKPASLVDLVARVPQGARRAPATGAMPVYRRPRGR